MSYEWLGPVLASGELQGFLLACFVWLVLIGFGVLHNQIEITNQKIDKLLVEQPILIDRVLRLLADDLRHGRPLLPEPPKDQP